MINLRRYRGIPITSYYLSGIGFHSQSFKVHEWKNALNCFLDKRARVCSDVEFHMMANADDSHLVFEPSDEYLYVSMGGALNKAVPYGLRRGDAYRYPVKLGLEVNTEWVLKRLAATSIHKLPEVVLADKQDPSQQVVLRRGRGDKSLEMFTYIPLEKLRFQ